MIEFLRVNDFFGVVYVELFVGGVGIVWCFLFDSYVFEVWINDIDFLIYLFWNVVLYYMDDLCELIEIIFVIIDEWCK